MASASPRISSLYLGIVILGLAAGSWARADEEVSEIAAPTEIEAKAYDLKTVRPSRSGRVYLFQKFDAEMPMDGKIFLLRQGDTPVMALRVLKTYPSSKRVAAKKLLPYENFANLAPGSQFRAFEKIGDRVSPVPPTPEDLKDLSELESGTPEELPPESVADTTPAPEPEPLAPSPTNVISSEEGDEDLEVKETEEENESDEVGGYFPNFFTMAVGFLEKSKVPGPDTKFGGGLLYSRNLGTSFAIEGGFYYYNSSGDETGTSISMTVLPITGNIRYQKRFAEIWTGYLYAGLYFPYVLSNLGATARDLAEIQVVSPAIGVGMFLQTGPNWYLRMNLGVEAVSLGVTLRF